MEWFSKHADTIIIIFSVISSLLSSVIWMNGKFLEVEQRFSTIEKEIITTRSEIEKEIAIIKTVLIMKNIMPNELANKPAENN